MSSPERNSSIMQDRHQITQQKVIEYPAIFLGSLHQTQLTTWLVKNKQMVNTEIVLNPGILKIYNDLLLNAVQNRHKQGGETTLINISVKANGTISILNNGAVLTPEDVPSVFSLEPPVEGCRVKGYSVKLANIFSTSFYVETARRGKEQEGGIRELGGVETVSSEAIKCHWRDNMTKVEPIARAPFHGKPYTKVCLTLDLPKLGVKTIS